MAGLDRSEKSMIIVVGRMDSAEQGVWLHEDCGINVVRGGREFTPSIALTCGWDFPKNPLGFRWNKPLIQEKLNDVKETTRLRVHNKYDFRDGWYAVLGRIETQLPHKMNPQTTCASYSDRYFGPPPGAPAQLVVAENAFLKLK